MDSLTSLPTADAAAPSLPSVISVRSAQLNLQLTVSAATSIRQALDLTPLRVRAACGGMGSCGACLIKIVNGEFNPPTLAERQKLLPEDLADGVRLACQLYARGPAELYVENPAPPADWRSIDRQGWRSPYAGLADAAERPYGLAVDLGSTQIRLSFWHLPSGRLIGCRQGGNPQVAWGADVLTRLDAKRLQPSDDQRLCQAAREAIMAGLRDILSRDMGEINPILGKIGKVLIVGNTVMLTLIGGGDSNRLYALENWQRHLACPVEDLPAWRQAWRMPHADIEIVQPLAGFVGSDLLADLLAIDIMRRPAPVLLLDLGTNVEMALWDGEHIWVTSVPGGPAFEGVGLRNGLSAEAGAIYQVSEQGQGWQLRTLGDAPIRGFCASGIIDAVAVLLRQGWLKPSGRFSQPQAGQGICLQADSRFSAIFASDIDIIQRAKAAVAAGMAQLTHLAGLDLQAISELWICGSLGRHLSLPNAMDIGLLPALPLQRMQRLSEASLFGCEALLLHPQASRQFNAILDCARQVNLGNLADYEQLFIENLRLQPLSAVLST